MSSNSHENGEIYLQSKVKEERILAKQRLDDWNTRTCNRRIKVQLGIFVLRTDEECRLTAPEMVPCNDSQNDT